MHIENLKIFSDLVESQSFSRAAKLNGITQSAVSQQLRAMEKHFNVLIVDRSQKQFRLTREGEKLFLSSRDILHLYDQMISELLEMKKVISGSIHVATIYSIGLHELTPYIRSFMKDYPAVNVRVEYQRSNMVYENVLHNAVDLGLVAYPVKMRQIEVLPFREDKMVAICSPQNELAKAKSVTLAELAKQNLVGFEPDIPTRKATDQLFRDASLSVDPILEFDNIETVKRAVEIDHGVAIVPLATITQELAQKQLVKISLKGVNASRPLAVIFRKGRVHSPAIKKFLALLKSKDLVE